MYIILCIITERIETPGRKDSGCRLCASLSSVDCAAKDLQFRGSRCRTSDLVHNGSFVNLADVANQIAEAPLSIFPKQIFAICIDTAEFSPADKFLEMTRANLGTTTSPHTRGSPIKISEHRGYRHTCKESGALNFDSILTDSIAGISPLLSTKTSQHQLKKTTPMTAISISQQLREFKMKVMKALLSESISSNDTHSYPVTAVIKVSNEPLTRDLVAQFLMGPNSTYLLIYNWREQLEVLDENGHSFSFNHELLKWMHTIGSKAAASNSVEHQMVSTMLVVSHFNEVLTKAGYNQTVARELMDKQVFQFCESLKGRRGHICAHCVDTEPILLGYQEDVEETTSTQLAKLANGNFASFKLSPEQLLLLNTVSALENKPVMSLQKYLQLASDMNMSKANALLALKNFNEMRLVFSLPVQIDSKLKDIIFTDLEFLVNELFNQLTAPQKKDRGCLWAKWDDLMKSGMMAEAIATQIIKNSKLTHDLLPSEWIFDLLSQLYLFVKDVSSSRSGASHFCPLYLPERRMLKPTPSSDDRIQAVYLRPSSGCITDQHTMRLFCWIARSQIMSLQECVSRTQAVFISNEFHLRFTFSCSMDCLKIEIESSFTGKPLHENASDVAHYLISRVIKASEKIREVWYPILLAEKGEENYLLLPSMWFECNCQRVDYAHLAEVIFKPTDKSATPFLMCEKSQQATEITKHQKFWTEHVSSISLGHFIISTKNSLIVIIMPSNHSVFT